MRPGTPLRPPPRLLVAASLVVLGVCAVLAVLGAFRTGISTDEPIHVMRLRNYFDNGWYALDWDYDGAGPGTEGTNTFVYAPVAMLLLHAWSVLWGVEGWGEIATSPHAYDIRHLGVAVIGFVGLAAVAAIGRVLLRSWGWGVVAAATLAAIPMWTGHEMFNVKDVPVATGYTLATLGLLCFVRAERPGRALAVGRAACLVAGLVLALGTRPGMWPGLLGVLVIAVIGNLHLADRRAAIRSLSEIAGSCAVAAGALVAIYPHLFGAPLQALPRTTESSSSFRDGLASDRLYVPRHLVEEMPTLLLFFVVTGLVIGGWAVLRQRRTDPVHAARVGMVGVQAAALPVVAVLMGSDLYHGLRQLLFAAPASAVLGAYGMAWWLASPRPRTRRLVSIGAVAGLLLPVVDQVTLQPYQTTYVNLATDLVTGLGVPPEKRPGGDFWRVSLPELIEDQELDRQLLCKSMVGKLHHRSYRFTNGGEYSTSRDLDCREEPNGPLAPEHLPVVRGSSTSVEYDAVFLKTTPVNCERRAAVTRWRHGVEVVLTLLARCTSTPPIIPTEGVHADSTALGTAQQRDLWRYAADGWERWPTRSSLTSRVPEAIIAFRAGGECRVYGCTLQITGSGPADLIATVGGDPVRVFREPNAFLVPISAARASARHGVWITLGRASGGTLGVTMTGLSEQQLDENHLKPTEGQR